MKNAGLITTIGKKIVSAALVLFVMLSLVFVTDLRVRAEGADGTKATTTFFPAEMCVDLNEEATYLLDVVARDALTDQQQNYYYDADNRDIYISIYTKTFYGGGYKRYYSFEGFSITNLEGGYPQYVGDNVMVGSHKISADQREITLTLNNIRYYTSEFNYTTKNLTITFKADGGNIYA